ESEAASSQAVYPHLIFEVGKTVEKFDGNDSGTLTSNTLGMLKSDAVSGYNDISSIINTLLYFLKVDYTLQTLENDPRFIPGRCATIIDARGRKIGFFGEVHPQVLENWGIAVPTTAAQINVDSLVELDTK
ncbi:MAG: phenylalanine--tRNA ligase subunit beta, partial [Sphaerochaetaceae bacterium]